MKVLVFGLFCIVALQGCVTSGVGNSSGNATQASGSIDTWYDGGINEHDHDHHAGHGGRGR
jgi:hypothetical protein